MSSFRELGNWKRGLTRVGGTFGWGGCFGAVVTSSVWMELGGGGVGNRESAVVNGGRSVFVGGGLASYQVPWRYLRALGKLP